MDVQLVTRSGCHLCQTAAAALESLGIAYEVLDVDADAELLRLYDFRVPVVLGDGRPIAEGRIDETVLRTALSG